MTSTIEGTQRRAHELSDSDSQTSPYHEYIDGRRYLLRWRDGLRDFSFSEPPIPGEAMLDMAKVCLRGRIRYTSPDQLSAYLGEIWGRGEQGPFRIDTSQISSSWRKITVRPGWLFSGEGGIGINSRDPGTASILLTLHINPIRFLAHNPANLNELAELSAHRVLRLRPERKGLIRRATLCGNDNALLDVARLGGSFLHNRAERWERALEVFITHLRTLFEYELVPSPTSHFAQFPVYDDLTVVLNWRELSIQQAEICWDYKTPDALSLMATINHLISAVAPEVHSTVFYDGSEAYRLERKNNALKVRVPLTDNIMAGFYAKTPTRLRAEIKYRGNVKQLCRTRIQGHRSFVELFSLVREDAAARFLPIFQSLAAHATTVEPEAQDIAHTLARIAAATEGDEDLLQRIMSILINTGGISELGDDPQRRAIQRLVRDGMLHRLPIRHGGVPRYVLTPNARADLEVAVRTIRDLAATPDNRQPPRSHSVH